jgi:hypothetical protein
MIEQNALKLLWRAGDSSPQGNHVKKPMLLTERPKVSFIILLLLISAKALKCDEIEGDGNSD